MVRRWVWLVALALGSPDRALGESIFSSLGLGESLLPGTARARAMGGTGISVFDSVSSSFLNPATASLLHRVTLSVVYAPEVRFPKGPEGTSRNRSSRFAGLKVIFPLPRRAALSLGLLPLGNMNSEANWEGQSASAPYLGRYEREGGLSSVPIHVSFAIRDRIFLAGGVELTQVSSREIWSKTFASRDYQDSEDVLEGEFSGTRVSGGMLVVLSRKASVGFVASQGRDLDGTLTTLPVYGKEFESKTSLHLPGSYGVGLCYHPKPGWSVALEGWRTRWGDLRIGSDSPLPDRASNRISVGIERAPTRRAVSWLARLPFRMGYWREPQAFDRPLGEEVVAQMITVGTGLPLRGEAAWLDLAVEVGRIGSISSNDAEERIVRFSLTFTGAERWHRKRQTRY